MSRSQLATCYRLLVAFMVASLALTGIVGCSSDKSTNPNNNPGTGSTTFTGSVTGTGANGTLTIILSTSSPAPQNRTYSARGVVNAIGTFTPTGGSAIVLTGSYDDASDVVALSGGGWSFGGGLSLSGNGMEGNAVGPGGELGWFSLIKGSSADVTVIVGTYTSTTVPAGENGNFNISIKGTEVHGNAVNDAGDSAIPLDGTYYAVNGAISIVNPANPGGPPLATGTYTAGTRHASGQYDDGQGSSGDWQGDKQ